MLNVVLLTHGNGFPSVFVIVKFTSYNIYVFVIHVSKNYSRTKPIS